MNLATEYRPNKFSEVVGQSLPVKALKKIAEAEGISARSILMQGSYGSGKCQTGDTVIVTGTGIRKLGSLFTGLDLKVDKSYPADVEVFVSGNMEKISELYYSGYQKTKK